MPATFSDEELEAYLDESLDAEQAQRIEIAMRTDATLIARLAQINRRRDAGVHTLGEIWRCNQVGVPDRSILGQYLLGALSNEAHDYVEFRLKILKCPYTIAGLNALKEQQGDASGQSITRRKKYFHSSAGLLKKKRKPDR